MNLITMARGPLRFRHLVAATLCGSLFAGPATRAVADGRGAANHLAWHALGAPSELDAFEADLQIGLPEACMPLTQAVAVRAEFLAHSRTLSHDAAVKVAATLCEEAARERVDPLLLLAIVAIESNFNHLALSPVGAEGLMQLMPQTAEFLAARGKIDRSANHSFDPVLNVRLGARYLAELDRIFAGQLDHTLTAYNRGPAATRALLRVHGQLPKGVRSAYAQRVLQHYDVLRAAYAHLDRA